jgi:hypothetical protein
MRDPSHEAELDKLAEGQAEETWPLILGGQGRSSESVICSGWWVATLAAIAGAWLLVWGVVSVVS